MSVWQKQQLYSLCVVCNTLIKSTRNKLLRLDCEIYSFRHFKFFASIKNLMAPKFIDLTTGIIAAPIFHHLTKFYGDQRERGIFALECKNKLFNQIVFGRLQNLGHTLSKCKYVYSCVRVSRQSAEAAQEI